MTLPVSPRRLDNLILLLAVVEGPNAVHLFIDAAVASVRLTNWVKTLGEPVICEVEDERAKNTECKEDETYGGRADGIG